MENIEKFIQIDEMRKKAIVEIKEKARKNPKILSPFNKERLEYQKKLKFNGNEFTHWMQQNGIMKNPTDVNRKDNEKVIKDAGCNDWKEYKNKCAQNAGFKDNTERIKEWTHETGRRLPKEFNEDCSAHFGDFTESIMIQTFDDAVRMPYGNPGFDWVCNKGDKIDNKGVCLVHVDGRPPEWVFGIKWNNIADWFILSAWDNRDSLTPLHVWTFHKNDIVRGRKFWRRDSLTITNTQEGIREFEEYEVTDRLKKLKELCRIKNNEN